MTTRSDFIDVRADLPDILELANLREAVDPGASDPIVSNADLIRLVEYVNALENMLVEATEVLAREDGGVPMDLVYFLRDNGLV